MSRYNRPLPFSPANTFEAAKVVRIEGIDYLPGEIIVAGLHERLLRRLYEQRRIQPVDPSRGPALTHAAPGVQGGLQPETVQATVKRGKPRKQDGAATQAPPLATGEVGLSLPAASAGGDAAPPADTTDEDEQADTGGYSVVKPGMGGWRVLDAQGSPVGEPYDTEAEANSAAAALRAG